MNGRLHEKRLEVPRHADFQQNKQFSSDQNERNDVNLFLGYPGRGGDPFSPSERNLPPRDRKPEVTGPESPAHTSSSHA